MKNLTLTQMENIEGGRMSWACVGGGLGMIALGIGLTVTTAGVGSLAWAGMMIGAVSTGGSLAHCAMGFSSAAPSSFS